jgi:hypothetical protein
MMRLILLGIGALLLTATVSSAQSFNEGVYYQVQSRNSGKCLDVRNVSVANGGQMQQWDCAGAQPNQLWTVLATGSGSFRIVSANSAKCIDVPNASTANGTYLQQWECNLAGPQSNQVYTVTAAATGGYYRLSPVHTSGTKCMDVEGSSTASGANIQQWDCGPGWQANQDWAFVPYMGRTPLTHLKFFEYYVTPTDSQLAGIVDHVSTATYGWPDIQNQNPGSPINVAIQAGKKVTLSPVEWLFIRKPKHCNDPDVNNVINCDIYANRYDATGDFFDGGLRWDYGIMWDEQVSPALKHWVDMGVVYSFVLPDEPHNLYGLGFSYPADIDNEILARLAGLMKRDFPTIPVQVVDGPAAGFFTYNSQIDWVGFDCYDCSNTDYMNTLNAVKNNLHPNQSIVLYPKGFVARGADPNGFGFGTTYTSQAEQDALVSRAEFYINTALNEPRVIGLNVFLGPTLMAEQWYVGVYDMATVKAKWRFLWRALGSGTP